MTAITPAQEAWCHHPHQPSQRGTPSRGCIGPERAYMNTTCRRRPPPPPNPGCPPKEGQQGRKQMRRKKQNRCKPAIVIPAQHADLRVSQGQRLHAVTRFRGPMCNYDGYQDAASRDMNRHYYRHLTSHGGLPNIPTGQVKTPGPATKSRGVMRAGIARLACIVRRASCVVTDAAGQGEGRTPPLNSSATLP